MKEQKIRSFILTLLFSLFFSFESFAQQQIMLDIKGTVWDENSEPMIGATIFEDGNNTNATASDIQGNFTIKVTEGATLNISFLGYAPQKIKIKDNSALQIQLEPESILFDDVVVVGYGIRKKVTLSGAIGVVDGKELESKPFPNVSQALQGRVPGLVVNRSGGAPGKGASFQIRGISSVHGGSPLVLVDGAETDINSLNMVDIESISVLKDATASIYGARASDGVILITTKSGKKGKLKIDVNTYYALKKPTFMRETVNLYEYAMMGKDAASDGSVQPGGFGYEYYKDEDIQKILNNDPNPEMGGIWTWYPKFFQSQDWYDALVGNGSLQNYNIGISGGTDVVKYLISGEFQDEDGIAKLGNDNFKRYNIRSKIDLHLFKNLVLKTNISYSVNEKETSVSDYFFAALNQMRCWAPIYTPNGNYYRFQNYPQVAQMIVEGGMDKNSDTRINVNLALEYEIMKGLKLIGSTAINNGLYYSKSYSRTYEQYDWEDNPLGAYNAKNNSATNRFSRSQYRLYNIRADYNAVFGKHNISAMIGAEQEQNSSDNFDASRYHFPNNELFELALGDSDFQYSNGWGDNWAIRSYFGRVGYIFDNKYILDGVFRYQASSSFHPDYRWGFFPGASAAWVVSEEPFLRETNIFDQLKLRLSYGETGNQSGIGLYDYIARIAQFGNGYYPFGLNGSQSVGKAEAGMVSLTRKWETIQNSNIGIDIRLLNNRLAISADYFKRRNKNMLAPAEYPHVLGIGAPYTNRGELKTNGYELILSWNDKIGKDFEYGITATLSDARNKVTHYQGVDSYVEGLTWIREGYATNSYFGYLSDGYIQTEEELNEYKKLGNVPQSIRIGDMKYKDLDGDGVITPYGDSEEYKGDMVHLGDAHPRYNYGINIDLKWKGFDFSAFFQGVGQRKTWLEGINGVPYYEPWYDPSKYFYGNTWTEDNRDAKYPRLTFNSDIIRWNYRVSDKRLVNSAYLRLKNLQIGYTIPTQVVNKIKLSRVRIYLSGSDLFEWHSMPSGFDPEDPKNAVQYPFTRFYSIGANISF